MRRGRAQARTIAGWRGEEADQTKKLGVTASRGISTEVSGLSFVCTMARQHSHVAIQRNLVVTLWLRGY